MSLPTCPARERLQAYVHGRLDRASHETVEGHLDECPTCRAAVETLDGESSFGRWRAPALAAEVDEAVLQPLAERAKRLALGPEAPRHLGNYLLHELLGAGGMGQVYRAEHQVMKRTVAVKLLAPDLFRSEAARARFRREVELAGRVASPHVVTAHDAGEAEGQPFLVMEYVAGRSLADLVKQHGPLPVRLALQYVRQAARGLADAHAAGIVHRDVKPSNLLVDANGTVKVLDLGLARAYLETNEKDSDLTHSRAVMGTAAYMAPEQAADTRSADARADIYSLGCTLFFLLTGQPPFEGKTVMEVLFAHRERPLPSPTRVRPDCPPAVDALLRRMTAKRPEHRPADMKTVLAELDCLLAQPLVPRRGAGRWIIAAGVLAAVVAALLLWALWPPGLLPPVPPKDSNDQPLAQNTEPTTPEPKSVIPVPPVRPVQPAGPEMVRIQPGEFLMGSPDGEADAEAHEKPRHKVRITRPFWLGKFEVTQEEFQELMGRNPSAFSPEGRSKENLPMTDTKRLPVESVSWLDAIRFCNKLSEKHGLKPYYDVKESTVTVLGGAGYRLPTEAEWEYACRAGTETRWSFGD